VGELFATLNESKDIWRQLLGTVATDASKLLNFVRDLAIELKHARVSNAVPTAHFKVNCKGFTIPQLANDGASLQLHMFF